LLVAAAVQRRGGGRPDESVAKSTRSAFYGSGAQLLMRRLTRRRGICFCRGENYGRTTLSGRQSVYKHTR